MGGANKSNFIPGDGSKPNLGSNSTPKGKGAGFWVSGKSSTRGQETPSFNPQTSVNQKTSPKGWSPTWSQARSSPSKGLGYKAYDAPNTSNPYKPPSGAPKGTNLNINTRGGSALAKGLGGGVAVQATKGGLKKVLTKANPFVAAVLLILDIVLADRGIVSNKDELAALEEWNRQVGEKQDIGLGNFTFSPEAIENNNSLYLFGTYKDESGKEKYWRTVGTVRPRSISSPTPRVRNDRWEIPYVDTSLGGSRLVDVSKNQYDFESRHSPYSFQMIHTADYKGTTSWRAVSATTVKASPNGNSGREKVETESTTDYSNIPSPQRATNDNPPPPGIRPPFPSAVTKTPKAGIESNTSPSTKQPKIEAPSPTPQPIPTLEPKAEKTIEEVEKKSESPTSEPNIISETKARRADGVIETTTVREATEDEMKEFKKKAATANRELDNAQKVIEKDREFREFKRNINPFGDETDFFYRQGKKFDTDTDTVEETTRQPPSKIGKPPSPLPKPKTPNYIDKPSEPDKEDEDKKIPFIPPTPIKQASPDKCRGTCAGNNGLKLDALTALLTGTGTAQNAEILGIVKNTNAVINHKDFGLAKVQKYAETAWKVTRADKIVNALNTMLIIHNGLMLSNNMLDTVSVVAESGLQILGIRDEEDKPIDIGSAIGSKIKGLLERTLGKARYEELTKDLASKMRIYQSGANMLYNIRSIFDSAQDIAETTGENVAFIGNALRRDGVVRENSYRLMPTDLQPSSRLLYRLERANDALDTIEEVISDARDIKEELGEMKENAKVFNEEVKKATDKQQKVIDEAKFTVTSPLSIPAPTEIDEERKIVNGE